MADRGYKRVRLALPAAFRDALDRSSALGNGAWMIALLLYLGWIVFFIWFCIDLMIKSEGDWQSVFSGEFVVIVTQTAIVGLIAFAPGALMRIGGGLLLAVLSYQFLSLGLTIAWSQIGRWEAAGYILSVSNVFGVYALLALNLVLAQILLASLALVLFGRDRAWPAFASGGGHEDNSPMRILYWLGVADTGFYRGGWPRAVMLFAKFSLALGIAASLAGFPMVWAYLPGAVLAGPAELSDPRLVSWLVGAGLAAIAISFGIGLAFRRFFPPPQFAALDEFGDRPIFLRAFRDDNVRLRNAWSLSPLPLPPDVPRNLDEIILARLPETIAIGRPDDPKAPFGVPRHYLRDVPWQNAVGTLLERSQLVIIAVDEGDGLAWEIAEVLARGLARKTKFIVHPKLSLAARLELGRAFAIEISRSDLGRLRGLDVAENGDVRAYLGPANSAAYRCMLGGMLQPS
jgi:hypothetical protein